MTTLATLLSYANPSMTDFQLDRSVTVRAGGTPYGCFFQALRELLKRTRGLRTEYIQRRKLRAQLAATPDDEELPYALSETERSLKHNEHEFLRFYGQAQSLFVHLGFDREPPTAERLAQLELERQEHHVLSELAAYHIAGHVMQPALIQLIQAFPSAARRRIVKRAFGPNLSDPKSRGNAIESLSQWFLNHEPDLPEPLAIPADEARRLLQECESLPLLAPSLNSLPMDSKPSPWLNTVNGLKSANHAGIESVLPAGFVAVG